MSRRAHACHRRLQNTYQNQYEAYHAWQQEQWRAAEGRLPSNTTTLTTSNIRQLLFWGNKPWLVLVRMAAWRGTE